MLRGSFLPSLPQSTVPPADDLLHSHRCLYLSRTYALVEKFPSALSLNARAKLYARESRSSLASLDVDDEEPVQADFAADLLPLSPSTYSSLDTALDLDYAQASKGWFDLTGGVVLPTVGDEPEDLPLAELDLDGVAGISKGKGKKEEFYDVAFSYVVAFDLEAIARKAGLRGVVESREEEGGMEVEEGGEEGEKPEVKVEGKKGWGFGLFGRK